VDNGRTDLADFVHRVRAWCADRRTGSGTAAIRAVVLIFVGVQAAVFGVVAKQAYTLSVEIASLKERIVATALAEQETASKDECVGSVWPNIPLRCLKRIPPSDGRVDE